MRAGAEVDVVGLQGDPGELRVRVGVLDGQPATGQHRCAVAVTRVPQPLGGGAQRVGPGRLFQLAGLGVADQRTPDAILGFEIAEGEAALDAEPFLVDLGVVAGQLAHDLAAPEVGPLGAAGRAVLAYARRGHQVERPGPEPVGRAGQRADRADLDDVAGEVALERLPRRRPRRHVQHVGGLRGADLLVCAAFEKLDERVTGDLRGEPGAALAEHAALAVQQDL